MLAFRDATIDVREPKSARLEQRTKPRVKEVIEKAAACLGVDTSDFVTSAAYREAIQTLSAQRRTALDERASRTFFAAMEAVSSQPNDAMVALMEDYEVHVENAIR